MPKIYPQTLYQNTNETPLGQIYLAGILDKSLGRHFQDERILGKYAIVYLLDGRGVYYDANSTKLDVAKGDLIVLFPELEHSYGPRPLDPWIELFVVFDGPIFELGRDSGLLSSDSPVRRLNPEVDWGQRLSDMLSDSAHPYSDQQAAKAQDACRLLALLIEMLGDVWVSGGPVSQDTLMARAMELLSSNLGVSMNLEEVAQDLNLSYESFRKRFKTELGVPPARYRLQKKLDAALSLLQHTKLTNKEIAESLAFSDSFHFCREFKKHIGQTPGEYRREFQK
jgi:AraC-like DNA-binding protein